MVMVSTCTLDRPHSRDARSPTLAPTFTIPVASLKSASTAHVTPTSTTRALTRCSTAALMLRQISVGYASLARRANTRAAGHSLAQRLSRLAPRFRMQAADLNIHFQMKASLPKAPRFKFQFICHTLLSLPWRRSYSRLLSLSDAARRCLAKLMHLPRV